MMKRHRVHLLVLFVLCVQVVAPLFTAVPAAAPLSAVAAEPLDYPQPLAPEAQAIRQQAAAQAAEAVPVAEAPPLRAPGTITATTETAQEPVSTVFLPLVRAEGTASSELALAPDVWMAATAGWTIHELPALVVVRTPPEWQTTIVKKITRKGWWFF